MRCPERPIVISRSLKNPPEANACGPRFSSVERARPLASILEKHGPAIDVALSLLSQTSLFATMARRYLDG
jgi:hypothetical protein